MNYAVKIKISEEKTLKFYFKTLISALSFVRREIHAQTYPENSIFYVISIVRKGMTARERKILFIYKNNECSFYKGGEEL